MTRLKLIRMVMVVVAISAVAGFANATVLVSDNFNSYPLGNLITTPAQGGWNIHSGDNTQKPIQVVPSTLANPDGNAIVLQQGTGSGEDVNTPVGGTMSSSNNLWYSGFDLKVSGSSPLTTQDYFAMFLQGTSSFTAKVFLLPHTGAGVDGHDFALGIQGTSGSTLTVGTYGAIWAATDFSYGSTHRVVTAYDYTALTCKLWIDPDPALGPDGNTFIQVVSQYANADTAYAFRQSSVTTSQQMIDNLVVASDGNGFAQAAGAPVPEPGSIALLAGAMVAGLSWAARRRNRIAG